MRIRISFDLELPFPATDAEITEWLMYELDMPGATCPPTPSPFYTVDLGGTLDAFEWRRVGPPTSPERTE